MATASPLHRQSPAPGAVSAPRRRPALVPTPAQVPADPRCDYIPVPPVGYDDEGYPVEDSVSQSQKHSEQTADSFGVLRAWCQKKGLGEAFSDLLVPYRQGQKSKVVCPDLMVALRAERQEERTSYKLWEHPMPDFALEALSNSTWKADVGEKKRLYRHLGVREYWLYDPSGKRIGEQLRGYRLRPATVSGGREVQVYALVRPNRWGRRASEVLRLELCVLDGELRFHDPVEGRLLPTLGEADARLHEAEAERDAERAARQAADRRVAALEAQLREPSAGEREGPAPRMKEPSAGEREGLAPRMKEFGQS